MKTKPPCFDEKTRMDCPRRKVGCRNNCAEWDKWIILHAEEKNEMRKKKLDEIAVNDFLLLQGERTRRCNQARSERDRRKGK